MPRHILPSGELAQYQREGYLLVRHLFEPGEIGKLLAFAENDPQLPSQAYGRRDAQGKETKLALWNHAGDDLYSMFARHPRIVRPMEQLLAGEVYLYHMKMMLKEPRVGVASGLRLLVSQRLSVSADGELPDCRHSCQSGERLPASAARFAQAGAD
jgi:hypothetical protein